MTEYRFTTEIDVHYRDLDAEGHVNNAVYATYLEHARMRYIDRVIDDHLGRGEAAIAHVSIDYGRSITLGQDVEVGVRTTDIGDSSVRTTYEVRADGRVAATAEAVLVVLDPETGEPRSIPEAWRSAIDAYEPERQGRTGDPD